MTIAASYPGPYGIVFWYELHRYQGFIQDFGDRETYTVWWDYVYPQLIASSLCMKSLCWAYNSGFGFCWWCVTWWVYKLSQSASIHRYMAWGQGYIIHSNVSTALMCAVVKVWVTWECCPLSACGLILLRLTTDVLHFVFAAGDIFKSGSNLQGTDMQRLLYVHVTCLSHASHMLQHECVHLLTGLSPSSTGWHRFLTWGDHHLHDIHQG